MAITKEKKEEIVGKVADIARRAGTIVFVHFKGLPVAETTIMRSGLKGEGVGYTVVKKTLLKRALEDSFEGEMPFCEGEIAIAYPLSDEAAADATLPARKIKEFADKHKEKITIAGGVFESRFVEMAYMNTIAAIPSLPVLRGQFVNLINSPIQRFAVVLGQIAEKREA